MTVKNINKPTDATETLQSDANIGPLIEEHGHLELLPAKDTFQRFVRSIISQQVSTDAASAIQQRLFSEFDVTPEEMLRVETDALREAGLSRQKVEYTRNVAKAYRKNGYDHDYFAEMSNKEVIDELTLIKGVGQWTAQMFLQFCLGRQDVFPVEDLGIRRGMESLFYDGIDRQEMNDAAESWRPYRSVASLYLWRLHD